MMDLSTILTNLYDTLLYICGINNLVLAALLVRKAVSGKYSANRNLSMSMVIAALATIVFGLGYLIHAIYQPRVNFPYMASALSISFSHIGGMLLGFSYTSLLKPNYFNRRMLLCHLSCLAIGLVAYWTPLMFTSSPSPFCQLTFIIFFVHVIYLTCQFYYTYSKTKLDKTQTIWRQLVSAIRSIPKSTYIVVAVGILSGVCYALYPDSILIYAVFMIAAYYTFYFVYWTMTHMASKLIAQPDVSTLSKRHRIKEHLFQYNVVYHSVILVVATVVVYFAFNADTSVQTNGDNTPRLNITKHAEWDEPALLSKDRDKLAEMIAQSPDSTYINEALKLDSDIVSRKEALRITKLIDNMPASKYKGALQIMCINNMVFTYNSDEISANTLHDLLERGYKIAEGDSPVPQDRFYVHWNNIILSYSNKSLQDSVSKECLRLMEISRKYHQPIGMMFAYMAFGYNLMDLDDYQAAASNFDLAIEQAEKNFPAIEGKNWEEGDPHESDYLSTYYQAVAFSAMCHMDANDTLWMKKNEHKLLHVLNRYDSMYVDYAIYYALALYYDKWVSEAKYADMMARFKKGIQKCGYWDAEEDYNSTVILDLYYTALVRHELRAKHGDAAMALINKRLSFFDDTTTTYYADALLLQGKYEQAAKRYKKVVDAFYKNLNGRNRNIIQSMSASISEEDHRMEQMKNELGNKQTRILYNTLLTFILVVMLAGLSYFLYRQRQLNRSLSDALDAAERANNAKDIFLKNLGHEFRTPLNAVYGLSQILADRTMPVDEESTHEMADGIVKGAEQLNSLIDNIISVTDKLATLDKLEDVETVLGVTDKE